MAKRKRLTMDELAERAKQLLKDKSINIEGDKQLFEDTIKKAATTKKQPSKPVVKPPQT
jgi:hypothetical protein